MNKIMTLEILKKSTINLLVNYNNTIKHTIYNNKIILNNNSDLNKKNITNFYKLIDNYNANMKETDNYTYEETKEMENYLDIIISNDAINEIQIITNKSKNELKQYIKDNFFNLYSVNDGYNNCCAFEHIFLGEYMVGEKKGYHNWLKLYNDQEIGTLYNIQIKKTIKLNNMSLLNMSFTINNKLKKMTSIIIGLDPITEILIYTILLHYCQQNKFDNYLFQFEINKIKLKIQLYMYNGKLRTCYFVF